MKILHTWSGGKDSTLAAFLHLVRGDEVIMVCAIPYFTDDIPLLPRENIDFIYEKKYYFEKLGAKVYIIQGMNYVDYCLKPLTRGPFKGLCAGYPLFMPGKCGFMREAKKNPVDNFVKNISSDYVFSISYTADENKRVLRGGAVSLLRELGYTQDKVYKDARELNLLSPHYENATRDGCLLCPNGKCSERYKFFNQYNGTFDMLYDLQEKIFQQRSDIYPLRGKHFFIEDSKFISPNGSKISLFGPTIN